MKNLFAFIIVGAAVLMVWFLVKKKITETAKGYTALGGCANLPPDQRAACFGIKVEPIKTIQATLGPVKPWDFSWAKDFKPSAYTGHVTDSGLIAQFAGNGALELFTGNGALELYTGTTTTKAAKRASWNCIKNPDGPGCNPMQRASWNCIKNPEAPGCNPMVKPSCLSIWLNNVNNPNGVTLPIWPGLNCKASNRI